MDKLPAAIFELIKKRDFVICTESRDVFFPYKTKKDKKIAKKGDIPHDIDVFLRAINLYGKKYRASILSMSNDGILVRVTEILGNSNVQKEKTTISSY